MKWRALRGKSCQTTWTGNRESQVAWKGRGGGRSTLSLGHRYLHIFFFQELIYSRVLHSVHAASRNIRIFLVSWLSLMNFVRESLFEEVMRNSGSVLRSAFATTSSEGGMPGRMVRSQAPNVSQTRYSPARFDELDKLTVRWVSDHPRKARTSNKASRTRHS